jgi:hypothetical protein
MPGRTSRIKMCTRPTRHEVSVIWAEPVPIVWTRRSPLAQLQISALLAYLLAPYKTTWRRRSNVTLRCSRWEMKTRQGCIVRLPWCFSDASHLNVANAGGEPKRATVKTLLREAAQESDVLSDSHRFLWKATNFIIVRDRRCMHNASSRMNTHCPISCRQRRDERSGCTHAAGARFTLGLTSSRRVPNFAPVA